jgi:hypothetical protein
MFTAGCFESATHPRQQLHFAKFFYQPSKSMCETLFWTKRFEEGYQYLLQILNDFRFESQKERLLTNQKHFQDNLGIKHN